MNLWRLIIPSWRFFDRAGDTAILYVRKTGSAAPWTPVLVPPTRNLGNLFLNPTGNLYLACQGLVNRLVEEISDHQGPTDEVEQWDSFLLVKNLVEHQLGATTVSYQFKIEIAPAHGERTYTLLTSKEYLS